MLAAHSLRRSFGFLSKPETLESPASVRWFSRESARTTVLVGHIFAGCFVNREAWVYCWMLVF